MTGISVDYVPSTPDFHRITLVYFRYHKKEPPTITRAENSNSRPRNRVGSGANMKIDKAIIMRAIVVRQRPERMDANMVVAVPIVIPRPKRPNKSARSLGAGQPQPNPVRMKNA